MLTLLPFITWSSTSKHMSVYTLGCINDTVSIVTTFTFYYDLVQFYSSQNLYLELFLWEPSLWLMHLLVLSSSLCLTMLKIAEETSECHDKINSLLCNRMHFQGTKLAKFSWGRFHPQDLSSYHPSISQCHEAPLSRAISALCPNLTNRNIFSPAHLWPITSLLLIWAVHTLTPCITDIHYKPC